MRHHEASCRIEHLQPYGQIVLQRGQISSSEKVFVEREACEVDPFLGNAVGLESESGLAARGEVVDT